MRSDDVDEAEHQNENLFPAVKTIIFYNFVNNAVVPSVDE